MLRAVTITRKRVTTIATEHQLKRCHRLQRHLQATRLLVLLAPKVGLTQLRPVVEKITTVAKASL